MAQPPDENDGDLTWMRESPFRPPDWRWRLAQLSLKEKLPRRPETLDFWVRRIAKYLRANREQSTSSRPCKRSSFDHVLGEAARIRFASDPLIAGEMEAWVLADEPISLIAKHCGLAEGVVEAYEKCFFDARTRLEAKSYINHIVLGPSLYTGFDLEDLPAIWRVVGYYRGRFSLAVALAAFPGSRVRRWPDWYEATPAEQSRLVTRCKLAVMTRCIRIEELTPAELFRLLLLNERVQRESLETEHIGSGLAIGKEGDVASPLLQTYLETIESIVSRPDDSRATLRPGRRAGNDQKDISVPRDLPAGPGFGGFDKSGGPVAASEKESA
jgi:hypothetical protein